MGLLRGSDCEGLKASVMHCEGVGVVVVASWDGYYVREQKGFGD